MQGRLVISTLQRGNCVPRGPDPRPQDPQGERSFVKDISISDRKIHSSVPLATSSTNVLLQVTYAH